MKKKIALALTINILSGSITAAYAAEPEAYCGTIKEEQNLLPCQIIKAAYPEMSPYPDESLFLDKKTNIYDSEGYSAAFDAWFIDKQKQQNQQTERYADSLNDFFSSSMEQFLSDSDGENLIYSPVNIYMALAMLAEVTDGNSREQILNVLGSENIEDLRTQANAVWNANYCADGATTSILASSMWLNEDIHFISETLERLANTYYASSFSGEMGSEEMNQALRSWMNEQTGDFLSEQAKGLSFDPETVLALATTIYFKAKWNNEFLEEANTSDIFYSDNGEITCDFMHQSNPGTYYLGEGFSAAAKGLEESGNMWFILPDEGVSPDKLISDSKFNSQLIELFQAQHTWENQTYLTVNLSVPKFDAASKIELSQGLKNLGITDVFHADLSDYSPLTEDADDIFLSNTQHAARVAIDEKGCTAAAYTMMTVAGAAIPPEETVDFILNRPFIFAITSKDGLPLFIGLINQPI